MATRSPWPASTCRSTQFTATFREPPTNHLANGAPDQSSTSFHGLCHCKRPACFAQKAERSLAASYISAEALACAANFSLGGNRRSSVSRFDKLCCDASLTVGSSFLMRCWLRPLRRPECHPQNVAQPTT